MVFKEGVYKMIKKDCFAYDSRYNKCLACRDLKCEGCAFYKPNPNHKQSKPKIVTKQVTLTSNSV